MLMKFKKLISVILILIGFVLIGFLIWGFSNNPERNEEFPKTFDSAVDHIIESLDKIDKSYIKSIPKYQLINFHFGWGTGIRNGLGLWGKNRGLIESCAKRIGETSIHADDASMMIIDGVWDKLNGNLDILNFDTIHVNNYFYEIHKAIKKAKINNDYLKKMPRWIYEVRRLSDFNYNNINRGNDLISKAKEIVTENSELTYLGLLYLTYYYEDLDSLNSILMSKFQIDDKSAEIPSFFYNDMNSDNLIILKGNQTKIDDKKVEYSWNKMTIQSLILNCIGSINNKRFNSLESFQSWEKLKESNYLIKCQNKTQILKKEFDSLLSEPIKLLKILTLTNKYLDFDENNDGLANDIFASRKNSIQNFIKACGFKNHNFKSFPYDSNLEINTYSNDDEYQQLTINAINSLSFIADKITVKELLVLLDSISIIEYNKTLKTDDLAEYKYFAGFLFATQFKKLLSYPDKNKVYDICYYYWKHEFISWKLQEYLTGLLVQTNPQRSNEDFAEYFKKELNQNSFMRNAILTSMIKYNFLANKEFLFNWFWKVYDIKFRQYSIEHELILSLLQITSEQTKELYNLIIKDQRFNK